MRQLRGKGKRKQRIEGIINKIKKRWNIEGDRNG